MCHARRGKKNHRVEFVRVSQYSEAYLPGEGEEGTPHMKGVRMLFGNLELNP